jgi:hypothetical protein
MTQEEKQEIFDWFLLNFDSYVHCYAYTASGEQIEVDESLEDYDIDWVKMEEDFNKNF